MLFQITLVIWLNEGLWIAVMVEIFEKTPNAFELAELADVAHQMTDALIADHDLSQPILNVAHEHPENPVLQLLAAIPFLFTEQFNLIEQRARPLLDQALSNEQSLNALQHLWCEAIISWSMQDYRGAIRSLAEITFQHPTDVLSCKIADYLYQMTGERSQHLSFLERLYESNAQNPDFLSMYAIALTLNHRHHDAQYIAEQALVFNEHHIGAIYAMGQNYLNTGNIKKGLDLLAHLKFTKEQIKNTPLAWLNALLLVGNMQIDEALKIYNEELFPKIDHSYQDLLNAITLIWMIELSGHKQDALWKNLEPHIQPVITQFCFPIATALCCFALARSGDQQSIMTCLDRLHAHILHLAGPLRSIWQDTGLPLCLGSIAYAREAYTEAQNYLAPIINNTHSAAGSFAQNRLIRLTHLSALIHNGYTVQAKHLLEGRLLGRTPTAFQNSLLSQCS